MDTTSSRWHSTPTTRDESTQWWNRSGAPKARYSPASVETGGIELSHLSGYAFIIVLMAGVMLLSAWSRIDRRETAVALDRSEKAYIAALAESSRLKLEVATLEDPAWLAHAANSLSLDSSVPVVDMTQPAPE